MFGARPADAPLVPGEIVPEALLRALKAVADPTRLKILKHLTREALTPSQLSRLLRLRPPTVIHHLNELRLAGLVQMTLVVDGERRYAVREESLSHTIEALEKFLRNNIEENE
ncbi:MAG: ArsR family transcriptional regulator [Chloroflexi bacterium]|nr:MAG: ArsR family transcriptional regulator [Chloroflexota bacterium]